MGSAVDEEILRYTDALVTRHALDSDVAQSTDLHSQIRGGVGGRGYGTNRHGLEIAWWVHPKRVRQELQFILESLELKGSEKIISIGCGPSFHEIGIAKNFPAARLFATDFDAKEIATAKQLVKEAGVTNVEHFNLPGENVGDLADRGPFDAAISVAVLHDVPGLEAMCKGLKKILKPGAGFAFTYNPPRQRAQFPDQPPLRDTIAKYFTLVREVPLVTPAHSREYFGAIADRSEKERGYPLRWDAIHARA